MSAILFAGKTYKTPSGRRWRSHICRFHGVQCVLMDPIGGDTHSGGGVRAMHVKADRLAKGDKIWRPE